MDEFKKLTRLKTNEEKNVAVDNPPKPKSTLPNSAEDVLKASGSNTASSKIDNKHNMYFWANVAVEDFCKKYTGADTFQEDEYSKKGNNKVTDADVLWKRCKQMNKKLIALSASRMFCDESKDDKDLNKKYIQDRIERLNERLEMTKPLQIKTKNDIAPELDRAFIEVIKSDTELFEKAISESTTEALGSVSKKHGQTFNRDLSVEENFEQLINIYNSMSEKQREEESIDFVSGGGTSTYEASNQIALFIHYAKNLRQYIPQKGHKKELNLSLHSINNKNNSTSLTSDKLLE